MTDEQPKPKRRYGGRRQYDMRWRKWLERIFVVVGAGCASLPGIDWYERQAMQKVLFQLEQQRVKELEQQLKAMQEQIDRAKAKEMQ